MSGIRDDKGVTLVELIVVMVVISILASVAMPMYRLSVKRAKEYELKRDLRMMRDAIDDYKRFVDNGWIRKETDSGYPRDMEILVDGVEITNRAVAPQQTNWNPPGQLPEKYKFLRKIPVDPMTGSEDWDMISNADAASDGGFSLGSDVFDVRSKSEDTALDGTKYNEW